MKTKTLEIPVYEAPDGRPTCAIDFVLGKVCKFLLVQRMGIEETCFFAESDARGRRVALVRSQDGTGYLIPCAGCPLHNGGEQK